MQPSLNIFRDHCHYFDDSGDYHKETPYLEYPPIQTIGFVLDDGRIMNLFLKYNPWKLIDSNSDQIVYQHCVFCGDKRFEHKKFNQIRPGSGESTIYCKKRECANAWDDLVDHKPGASKAFMLLNSIEKLKLLAVDQK